MIEKQLTVLNSLGLHARATARLVSLAMTFDSDVQISNGDTSVDAKSMLAVMTLGSSQHSSLTVRADGNDEERAMESIEALFNSSFEEAE